MVEQTRALWGNQQLCMVLLGGTNQSTQWKPAALHDLTWWNTPEHSEETSNLAWFYTVEQTRTLWGNQHPCIILHGGTNQHTLRKPWTLHGLIWWNKTENSEETSNLTWSYMVEQTRALWGNQQCWLVLHGGTHQSTLRKPTALWGNQQPGMVLHGVTNQCTLRKPATWHGLTWCNKPVHSEETSNLAWSYMLEQTRTLWGNQQPGMALHGGTSQNTLRISAALHGLIWWNKPEHSEETSNLAWSYMVEQIRALWENQQPYMFLHGGTNQSTLRKQQVSWFYVVEHTRALWGNQQHSEETSTLVWSYMV